MLPKKYIKIKEVNSEVDSLGLYLNKAYRHLIVQIFSLKYLHRLLFYLPHIDHDEKNSDGWIK
jgi:hypothetical protein